MSVLERDGFIVDEVNNLVKKGDDIIASGEDAISDLAKLSGEGFDADFIKDPSVRNSLLSICK